MQRTAILNGSNLNQDKDYSLVGYTLITPGIVEGLQVTTNSVGVGKAFIQVTRTSVTPNDVFYIVFENTSAVTIDTSGTKKVFVRIPKINVNDPGYNLENTTIATIETDTAYPITDDYIPLASITGGVITDARSFVKLKGRYVDGVLVTKEATPVASASTVNLSSLDGNFVHITGTTTINSFGNIADGAFEICFDSAGLTITNGSIRLPTGANIVTQAGDTMIVRGETTTGDWRVISYQRKDGSPLSTPNIPTTISIFTAGENLTTGDAVYISSADGKAYKCVASDTSKINFIGFVKLTASINTSVNIETGGISTALSGLTINNDYYLSNTAGLISTTPGTYTVNVGKSLSTTLLEINSSDYFNGKVDTQIISRLLSTASGAVVYNHNLGKIPKMITFQSYEGTYGTWVNGKQNGISRVFASSTVNAITIETSLGIHLTGVVSAVTNTSYTITWTRVTSDARTANIIVNLF